MKEEAFHKVPMTLTRANMMKLAKGKTCQLAHHQISHGVQHKHALVLPHKLAKRVQNAAKNKKGIRLSIAKDQMEGSGIFDFLKKAGSWIKKNVIDTPFYQNTIRPIAKDIVKAGINTFVPTPLRGVAQQGADFIGDKTGGFGLRHPYQSKDGSMSLAQQSQITNAQMAIANMNKGKPRMMKKRALLKGSGVYRN